MAEKMRRLARRIIICMTKTKQQNCPVHDKNTLEKRIGDVCYEMDRLLHYECSKAEIEGFRISKMLLPIQVTYFNDAFLEAFLVHFRNLRDFFFELGLKNARDLFACCYFVNPSDWHDKTQAMKNATYYKYYKNTQNDLNVYLAHLSINRKSRPDWDCSLIKTGLIQTWKEFLKIVPKNRKTLFEVQIREFPHLSSLLQ